jgi:hypothetical protein
LEQKEILPIAIPAFEPQPMDKINDETIDQLIDDVFDSSDLDELQECLQRDKSK